MKHVEISAGKQSLIAKIGSDIDHIFEKFEYIIRDLKKKINRRSMIVILQWIGFYLLYPLRKIYVEMKHRALNNPHSKKVIDAVRGKGEIRKVGVSAYLRRIGR
jgi:hypothetical protein